MTRPIWAVIANHYTKRRGLSASYLTQIAAQSSPEGGGGDYGPNSRGYDQLGFGTLAFTREKAATAGASPTASPTASPAASADPGPQASSSAVPSQSPSASASASPSGGGLAATGSDDLVGWAAAAGVGALAGGLLLLRRRDRVRGGGAPE